MVKCRMCKTTWVFGTNRLRGVCNKCAKIALNRNNMQVMASGHKHVVNAYWTLKDWPGKMTVKFKLEEDTYATRSISYDQAMGYKGNIMAWVDAEWKVVQDEHASKPE